MNQILKGGFICLLSFLSIHWVNAQNQITADIDPNSKNFGQIFSPELTSEVLDQLKPSSFTFDEWSRFFSVRVSEDARPTFGSYRVQDNQIVFTPRFLPDPNIQYLLTFSYESLSKLIETNTSNSVVSTKIQFNSLNSLATHVIGLTPGKDSIPDNLLRVYLHFSGPMGFENPYSYIKLLDEEERLVEDAFVELPEGLWNEDRTRLTILFHPGRVKRGVGPNMKQGAILQEGKSYALQISKEWPDANGNRLGQSFEKSIVAKESVRSKMKIKDWKVEATCNDSCRVVIYPDHLVDAEMTLRYLELMDSNNLPVAIEVLPRVNGTIELKSSSILPDRKYRLFIDPRLEDVCGNTFLNSFDYESGTRKIEGEKIVLGIDTKSK